MSNYFKDLSAVDVSAHIKEKGNFSYLSWPFAIEVLGQHHPEAEIQVKRFPLPSDKIAITPLLVPYLKTPLGYFVEVAITINNITRSQLHPILSYTNQPIQSPTVFDVNTSIQRATVKAIAMHGLGLFVYQGEDLPISTPDYTDEQHEQFLKLIDDDDSIGMYIFFQSTPVKAMIALNGSFPKGQKVKMKEAVKKLEQKGLTGMNDYHDLFIKCIDTDDNEGLIEAAKELGDAGKEIIWGRLDREHQSIARRLLTPGEYYSN